jgi:hypothetical protein
VVRPKKVLEPVAMTPPSISPCSTALPDQASSPIFLTTGSDSPVSAA